MTRPPALVLVLLLAAVPGRAALSLFREPSDGRIRPVQALADAGKPEDVLRTLTPEFMQTLRGTDLRQAYVLWGDALVVKRRLDEALGVYQLGVKLFPRNVDLLTRQAGILHQLGLDDQARPHFERALKYEPKHYGAHLGLAEIDRRNGALAGSAEHYEAALETLDSRAFVWRDYAEVLLAQRDWKTARLALAKARTLEPKDPDGWTLEGFARRAEGDLPGALEAIEEARKLGAGIGALRALALWRLEAGKHQEALAAAAEVLREAPADAAALWTRARVELALGRPSRALEELGPLAAPARQDLAGRAARALREAVR